MSGWISVKERFPEEEEYVLGLQGDYGNKQHVVMYNPDSPGWVWCNEDARWNIKAFTHWMPLPLPPL
jgi:hypothetical protein